MADGKQARTLGITVLADFILSEGVEPIIGNLRQVGATAVAVNPTVTAPAEEGTGSFQPPHDAGSSPRYFDRPLFGKKSLWVRSGPSFEPQEKFYADSPYAPRHPNDLTEQHGDIIDEFIAASKSAGLRVYFQVGAVQPSKLRDEDRPHQPDGNLAAVRMADTGSLASSAIRAYNQAYARDLVARYPEIDGFRIDWPEYPCYTMAELFHDFNPQIESWATRKGFEFQFDFDFLRGAIQDVQSYLRHELDDRQVSAARVRGIAAGLAQLGGQGPAIAEWFRLKAALSADTVAAWRGILAATGRSDLELTAHAFMPPYSAATGLDFGQVVEHCDAVSPKFYTMHWPLMVKFWADWLMTDNPQLDRANLERTLATWMELGSDQEIEQTLGRYYYPQPDEPHPIPVSAQQQKLAQVRASFPTSTTTQLVPLVHGYGPLDDFARRFEVIANAEVDGVWINRYGYLSDAKLESISATWRGAANE